jgi:hypothetical protein
LPRPRQRERLVLPARPSAIAAGDSQELEENCSGAGAFRDTGRNLAFTCGDRRAGRSGPSGLPTPNVPGRDDVDRVHRYRGIYRTDGATR